MSEEPPSGPAPGRIIDGFEVIRKLGAGGMAVVWLVRDLRLGRKAALKFVRPEVLRSEADRERFLVEARATARFNHPHIVTVYAVGEVDGCPYLVLEYLEGRDLRARLNEGPVSPREALRIGQAIAEALVAAHSQGVLHRDLKPENIVLPGDGRLRVVDFGLAGPAGVGAGSDDSALLGTPAYMAPELWLGEPHGPAVDCWALGLILFELLAGQRPWQASDPYELAELVTDRSPAPPLDPGLDDPPGLARLVAACLAKDPSKRPDAAGIVDRIRALLGPTSSDDEQGPFRGLMPFGEAQAHLFFGRDADVGAALERLRAWPTLTVVGPSGAGKSSFVHAGLVPRLRERGPLVVVALRPGRVPLATLARQVHRAGQPPLDSMASDALADRLSEAPGLLSRALLGLAQRSRGSVLLIVDQLEEIVTLDVAPAHRRAFLAAIALAADDPASPVRALFTVREEFLGRLAEVPEMARALAQVVVLHSPGADALRETLVRPVYAFGHRFDDETLPDEMVAEVAGEPAGLPLLQFAGTVLWQRRDRDHRLLRRSDYAAMGGVSGALARHADGMLATLGPVEQALARSLLLRLVTDEGTRQRLTRAELVEGLGEAAGAVLDRLVDARLLATSEAEVELVHESLTRSWGRLARWIDESHEDLAFVTEARQAAQIWSKRGQLPDEVWTGAALAEALRRAEQIDTLPLEVATFLAAGQRRRRARVRGGWLAALTVLAGLLAAIAVLAIQRQEAVSQRSVAEERQEQAHLAAAEAAVKQGLALDARANVRAALEISDSLEARGLWMRAERVALTWERATGITVLALAWRPDGQEFAVSDFEGPRLWFMEATTGAVRATAALSGGPASRLLFRSGGRALRAWTGLFNGSNYVWTPEGGAGPPIEEDVSIHYGRLSSGRQVEIRVGTHDALVTNAEDGTEIAAVELADPSCGSLAITPDASSLVVWCKAESNLGMLDLATGQLDWLIGTDMPMPRSVAQSGHWLAVAGEDQILRVVDLDARVLAWSDRSPTTAVDLHADRGLLVSGGVDGGVSVWSLTGGTLMHRFQAHDTQVGEVAISPDGSRVVSSGRDGVVRMWPLRPQATRQLERSHTGPVQTVAFAHDGSWMATGGSDLEIRLWDPASGQLLQSLRSDRGKINALDVSPDDRWLAAIHNDGTVDLWDVAEAMIRTTLRAHTGRGWDARFSPSGDRLATVGSDEVLQVWSVPGGDQLLRVEDAGGPLWQVAWSPNGEQIAAAWTEPGAEVWDSRTGALIHRWQEMKDWGWWRVHFAGPETLVLDLQGWWERCPMRGGPCARQDLGLNTSWTIPEPTGGGMVAVDVNGQITAASPSDGLRQADAGVGPLAIPVPVFSPDGRVIAVPSTRGYTSLLYARDLRPAWTTRALLRDPVRVLTHKGWNKGDGRISEEVRLTLQAEEGHSCSLSWDGVATLSTADGPPVTVTREDIREFVATSWGCALRTREEEAILLSRGGEVHVLSQEADAIGVAGGHLLVAGPWGIRRVDEDGAVVEQLEEPGEVTAMSAVNGTVYVGTAGTVRAVGSGDPFRDTPSSAAVAMLPGPAGTLIAGFDNGSVGVWDPVSGARLEGLHLHGPARYLALEGAILTVATALGDVETLDLGALEQDYCELLREIQVEIEVVPGPHGLERRPAGGPCARPPR